MYNPQLYTPSPQFVILLFLILQNLALKKMLISSRSIIVCYLRTVL
jgi:hypothetical protein